MKPGSQFGVSEVVGVLLAALFLMFGVSFAISLGIGLALRLV